MVGSYKYLLVDDLVGDVDCTQKEWSTTTDAITFSDCYFKMEDAMDMDFIGGIKKIDGHFLLQLGCKYYIVHDSKEAAKIFGEVFKEQFEKKEK